MRSTFHSRRQNVSHQAQPMQSAAPFGPTRPPADYASGLALHRPEEWHVLRASKQARRAPTSGGASTVEPMPRPTEPPS
jgi:hypothetical protein